MNIGKLSCGKRKPCRQGVWSRAVPVKRPSDALKLPNHFPGEVPFKVSYDAQPTPDMTTLMNYGYLRRYQEEHDAFMMKRKARFDPPPKVFPIYRKIVKLPEQPEKPIVPNKKYANVKSKVFNFYLAHKNEHKQWFQWNFMDDSCWPKEKLNKKLRKMPCVCYSLGFLSKDLNRPRNWYVFLVCYNASGSIWSFRISWQIRKLLRLFFPLAFFKENKIN